MGDRKHGLIAAVALLAIAAHLLLRFAFHAAEPAYRAPLLVAIVFGGIPLLIELSIKLWRREFSSDLLAGISIVTAVLLHEYLAGTLVVLMLSGGEALESYAVRSAASVLRALAKRMPSVAHVRGPSGVTDVSLDQVRIGDILLVYPHDICPVDGVVTEGHGSMDESYLTGEPYRMSKTPGSDVISGAINGDAAIAIRATKLAVDSRYSKIMQVMKASEQHRPKLRRLGDQLGAYYTPLSVAIAVIAWLWSGSPERFLAVLVVATPCPLLIAIPVAIIGAISLAARRAIIIKNPAVLEQIDSCRTVIFDKTGTLTYGEPRLTAQECAPGLTEEEVLGLAASLERYSKHPLAGAVLAAASDKGIPLRDASEISERPGQGLRGVIGGRSVRITSRSQVPDVAGVAPSMQGGMECVILIDGAYAATYRFRDEPRAESALFVKHLKPKHLFRKVMLLSGDRESEVRYLAERVGIQEVLAGKSPEEKLEIVRAESAKARTLFLGDGINDAPALTAATVGIAFGQNSDITSEAADAVVLNSSLAQVDELLHIGRRMRVIALQSAIGGMAASVVGMGFAAAGLLPPVAGSIAQEVIDVVVVLNALRAAWPPKALTDFRP
ncbi:MAG: heavy metal translocating P-type ATPase [Candidatus Eiseniibacteriota bacterium]